MKEYEWVEMKDMEWDYILRRMKWIEDPEITTKIYAWLESLIDLKDKLIFDWIGLYWIMITIWSMWFIWTAMQ